MRKIFFLLFMLLLSIVGVHAETFTSFESGGLGYYINEWECGTVTLYTAHKGTETIVNIPSTVVFDGTEYSVTRIIDNVFSNDTVLMSVSIPASIVQIGNAAFKGCKKLSSITIGSSRTYIPADAFEGTAWYDRQEDGMVYIGKMAYKYKGTMPQGTSVTIKDGTTSILARAFFGCTELVSVVIPNSVTYIGESAFYKCTSLSSISVPDSVSYIGGFAFYGTPWYESLPDGVVYIGNVLYQYKGDIPQGTSLSIAVREGTVSISDDAFKDKGITSVTIPNSVTQIGARAFRACSNLTSVVIPNGVTEIREGTFLLCNNLSSVVFPSGLLHIGSDAFYKCNLTSVVLPGTVKSITASPYNNYSTAFDYDKLHKFVCPNSDVAFNCQPVFSYALDTIVAPASVFDIEEEQWSAAPKYLKSVLLTNGELTDNVCSIINRSHRTLEILDMSNTTNTVITDEAFSGCYNLKILRLPSHLTKVSYRAVADCNSLLEIIIPASVEEIDNSAFENCRSMRSIVFEGATLPQGTALHAPVAGSALRRIGNWAFYNCHELQDLTISEGVTEIGNAAFYGCTYLQNMVLPGTLETIGDNAFALCGKLQKIIVHSATPPVIASKTFYEVNRTTPVYVPAGAVADYKSDRYWKELNIQAGVPTATGSVKATGQSCHKLICDGQVFIQRGDKVYTAMGIEVK